MVPPVVVVDVLSAHPTIATNPTIAIRPRAAMLRRLDSISIPISIDWIRPGRAESPAGASRVATVIAKRHGALRMPCPKPALSYRAHHLRRNRVHVGTRARTPARQDSILVSNT